MTALARKSVLVLLLATVACSSEVPSVDAEGATWAERESALTPVECPVTPADDPDQAICSGTIPAVSSCFVSLGSGRLRREIAQTFRVNRKGQAGKVQLVLRRLQNSLPDHGYYMLNLEVTRVIDGAIAKDPGYIFAAAAISSSRLEALNLNQDTPFTVNMTSLLPTPDSLPYTMDPEETYALVIRIAEGQEMAVGIACHEDPEGNEVPYGDGGAYSRQMRMVTAGEFTDPEFIADTRDLTFSFSLDDGCTQDKMIQCGVGACFREIPECVEGEMQTCIPGDPEAEVCDQIDNDCDGQTDEVVDLGTTTCGVGECERTVNNCVAGMEQTCVQGSPSLEVCDGKDNNCDGQTDEFEILGDTTCGVGVCTMTQINCISGSPVACVPNNTPAPAGPRTTETCNGIDDDCDGLFDENASGAKLTQPYWPGNPANRGKGICKDGIQTCNTAQSPVPYTPLPASWANTTAPVLPQALDVCNGLDDDCDGATDENTAKACWPSPGTAAQRGVGRCKDGTQACTAAAGSGVEAWGACVGATLPATEACNGLDDDCDGATDEGLGSTTCGFGRCQRAQGNCVNGSNVECQPDWSKMLPEVCNGIDDNCDGQIDEGLTEVCYTGPAGTENVGICRAGTRTCNAVPGSGVASWTPCGGTLVLPTPNEVNRCDNLDNNCDGQLDNPRTSICALTTGVASTYCQTGGTCTVNTCNAGRFDVDKQYGNGCECVDEGRPNACGAMTEAASVNVGNVVNITGRVPLQTSSDWIRIDFPHSADWNQRGPGTPTIAFTSNPGSMYRFEVRTYACAGGTWPTCGSSLDLWTYNDGHPECNKTHSLRCRSRDRIWPTSVFVRVYRLSGGETCDGYTLQVSRPSF